jgi:hypothetical protein
MKDGETPYTGPDQRRRVRRQDRDRRQEIRFEPDAQNRRRNGGRRKEDESDNIWRRTNL